MVNVKSDNALLERKLEDVYDLMLRGDNEIRMELDRAETGIMRYLPDEDLSLATGVSVSREVQEPIGDKEYVLAIAALIYSVVLSYESQIDLAPNFLFSEDRMKRAQGVGGILMWTSNIS